ncbi:hypothetical protein Tco_0763179 [Tanacetum coccineum]
MVPRAVLMKSGLVSINTARQNISKTAVLINTARQVNTTHSKTTVNAARPMSYLFKTAHSTVKRPINNNITFKNSNINQRVNTVRGKNGNTAMPKAVVNVGNPQMDLQDKGVIDSGCSRHMTGNMSYLTDYKEIDGGYVAFGGNLKGGKITRKEKSKKSVRLMMEKLVIRENRQRVLVRKRIERIGENKNRKRAVWNKNRQSDLVSKRIERSGELKNRKRVEYIKNRQSVWNEIGVNVGES